MVNWGRRQRRGTTRGGHGERLMHLAAAQRIEHLRAGEAAWEASPRQGGSPHALGFSVEEPVREVAGARGQEAVLVPSGRRSRRRHGGPALHPRPGASAPKGRAQRRLRRLRTAAARGGGQSGPNDRKKEGTHHSISGQIPPRTRFFGYLWFAFQLSAIRGSFLIDHAAKCLRRSGAAPARDHKIQLHHNIKKRPPHRFLSDPELLEADVGRWEANSACDWPQPMGSLQ